MNVKELFDNAENGVLTWSQFEEAMKAANAKFVDLSEGKYVSKSKYDDELAGRDTQISTLNDTIAQRDTDLAALQQQLTAAGADADKLAQVSNDLTALQGRYDSETKSYKEQLKKQAYEFAVREFAGSKKFSSNAAKRDFISSMIAKDLKMDKDVILGAEDFVKAYSTENADAFVAEEPTPAPQPAKPTFVVPTPGGEPSPVDSNEFASAFNFVGVRPHE